MRNQVEIKLAINDFIGLHEASVNEGTLWGIDDGLATLLEESLSDSLVDNNESDLWEV